MSTDDAEALARRARRLARYDQIIGSITEAQAACIVDNADLVKDVKLCYKKIQKAVGGPGPVNLIGYNKLQDKLNVALANLRAGFDDHDLDLGQIDPGPIPDVDYYAPNRVTRRAAIEDRRNFWGRILNTAREFP